MSSWASDVSADGTVVVGDVASDIYGYFPNTAFRWTQAGGIVALAGNGLISDWAFGVSADGSVVIGYGYGDGKGDLAYRWTAAKGMEALPSIPGSIETSGADVSADGSVAVGDVLIQTSNNSRPARWTSNDSVQLLSDMGSTLYNYGSYATGVSGDGTVVVGAEIDGYDFNPFAFRWTAASGLVRLVQPAGYSQSYANGISADGSAIVGWAIHNGVHEAFRWTATEGMVSLGRIGDSGASYASAASGDGSIVVGTQFDPNSSQIDGSTATIWDKQHGLRNLQSVLSDFDGLSDALGGWKLTRATSISADGLTIVGDGVDPAGHAEAWVAHLDGTADIAMLSAHLVNAQYVSYEYSVVGNIGQFTVGLYRSVDGKSYDPADEIASQLNDPEGFTLSSPLTADPTKPYLVVVADPSNEIVESDETNNVQAIPLTDIAMLSAKLASQTSVTFDYATTGDPGPFTVGLYRSADGQAFDAADPIATQVVTPSPTNPQTPGVFSLSTPLAADPDKPYLMVVADPGNVIAESDETNNVKSLATSNVVAISLTWDKTYGGVDFSYQVVGGALQKDVPIAFYWASDSDVQDSTGTLDLTKVTPDTIKNLKQIDATAAVPVPAGTAAQSKAVEPIPIDPTKLEGSPDDATYLIEVTDPNNTLGGFDPHVNVFALPLRLTLPVTYTQQQTGSTWAGTKDNRPLLGNSDRTTIFDSGCNLVDLAIALSYEGPIVDPLTLNNLLKGNQGGFNAGSADLILPSGTLSAARQLGDDANVHFNEENNGSTSAQDIRDELMQSASPVFVKVYHYNASGDMRPHYVLVTGFKDGDFTIFDPGYQYEIRDELSYYDDDPSLPHWTIRGDVRDPSDLSGLFVTAYSPTSTPSLLVRDDHGNVTGTNYVTGQMSVQIPNSFTYTEGPLDNLPGGPEDNLTVSEIDIYKNINGNYSIDVGAPGSYGVTATGFAPDGHMTGTIVVTGTTSLGVFSELKLVSSSFTGLQNADTPPLIALGLYATTNQGAIFLQSSSFTSPASGDFTATVDYGDGTGIQSLTLNPDRTFSLSHAYGHLGTFTVMVAVKDPFGQVGTQTEQVIVESFVSGFGPGRDAFVRALYNEVLVRAPEPAGLHFWSKQLASKVKAKMVATAFWTSRERHVLLSEHKARPITFGRAFSGALKAWKQARKVGGIHPASKTIAKPLAAFPFVSTSEM